MKIEVLISTMHQSGMEIFKNMNISSDALAINQYDHEYKEESIYSNGNRYRMISLNERGLSNSRNLAIRNSDADICVLADDDLVYSDNYVQIITDAYLRHPEADIIAFSVPCSDRNHPTRVLRKMKVNSLQSMKLCSVQLTFRRKRIVDSGISFNRYFGAGSLFTCGEENIFLVRCLQKGLKVIYINKQIAMIVRKGSTWFKGFDKSLFRAKGAMFYEMSRVFWLPLTLQYAIRKYGLYSPDMSLPAALRHMNDGRNEYRSLLRKETGR